MSSSANRRYKRKIEKLKKKGKLTVEHIVNDDMMLNLPTPQDVQDYIDNKVKELRVQKNGV